MSRDNLFAGLLFFVSLVAFFMWGYGYIPGNNLLLFVLASIFGLFMAFNIGGNDVANSFGTSVGAKTLTVKQALIIAAVFELSGAVFAGGEVTNTIRNGIVSLPADTLNPMLFVAVMISALFSAGAWLFFASKKGFPVSTTHSIVGGIVGGGLMLGYMELGGGGGAVSLVKWGGLGGIVSSWIISPIAGGIAAYFIYAYIKSRIITPSVMLQRDIKAVKRQKKQLKTDYLAELSKKPDNEQLVELRRITMLDEDETSGGSEFKRQLKELKDKEKSIDGTLHMRIHIPMIAGVAAIVITSSLLFKGLKNINIDLSIIQTLWIIFMIGMGAYLVSYAVIGFVKKDAPQKGINRIFGWFQIFTASAFAFSHGANDIANAVGPFAAILDVLKNNAINATSPIPGVAMATFGVSLVVGLWFLGKEVINTVGTKLAEIKPTTGFSAELGASIVILVATKMGLPISSTHVLIGAVLGIGYYNRNANWSMLKSIGLVWVITLPVSMIGSAVCFLIIRQIMGI